MRKSVRSLMLTALLSASLCVALTSCDRDSATVPLSAEGYTDFLYQYMPLPDSLTYPRGYWEANVAQTLRTREEMSWGVPEREFRHFVLPLRVNNENLDDFRTVYADSLCERVKGMSLYDAVLEINHWCHERVTYMPSDGRTSAPMATIATGKGRCGEESVLTVSALRAAGIPARQVYTPRWAHTDDNHAWVEAWVDGRWHFLGACEPEPVLDLGWFNAPVSRALLLHTKVAGDYHGDEDVMDRNNIYTEINVIRNYVPSRRCIVTVTDREGNPVEGALVEFKIYNYAEFYTVSSQTSDADGHAALDMGLGDMVVWAYKDREFGLAKAGTDEVTVVLDGKVGERYSADFDIVPPPENPLPNNATAEQIAANEARRTYEDSLRESRHTRPVNEDVINAFKTSVEGDGRLEAEAEVVLQSISLKDHNDVTLDVLEDALTGSPTLDPFVLNPRVELEKLLPYKAEIRAGLEGSINSPEELISWIKDSITIVEGRNPQGLRTAPIGVWRARRCDKAGRNTFFTAACRALGFPARFDFATGKTQFLKNDVWLDVNFEGAPAAESPKGQLHLIAEGKPAYFKDFTLTKLTDGKGKLQYDEDYYSETMLDMTLDEGYYLLVSGVRQEDGSVLARAVIFYLHADSTTEIPLTFREPGSRERKIVGHLSSTDFFTGGRCILFLTKDQDEPTSHATRQLEGMDDVVRVNPGDKDYDRLVTLVKEGCGADPDYLPYVLLVDKSGDVMYFSQGYNTSIKESLEYISSKYKP